MSSRRCAKGGFNVGGEQSGHIILSDFSTTGDGLIAALQVLAVLAGEGKPASEATQLYEPLPQILENIRFRNGSPLEDARVKSQIEAGNGAAERQRPAASCANPAPNRSSASWRKARTRMSLRTIVRDIASVVREVAV